MCCIVVMVKLVSFYFDPGLHNLCYLLQFRSLTSTHVRKCSTLYPFVLSILKVLPFSTFRIRSCQRSYIFFYSMSVFKVQQIISGDS